MAGTSPAMTSMPMPATRILRRMRTVPALASLGRDDEIRRHPGRARLCRASAGIVRSKRSPDKRSDIRDTDIAPTHLLMLRSLPKRQRRKAS